MKVANSLDKIIYADNAATTKIDDEALNLMIDLQRKYFCKSFVKLQNFSSAEKDFGRVERKNCGLHQCRAA